MKENVNASATGDVKVEIKPSDQITDLIFTKLNRLEEMMNQIYKDQAKVRYMIRDEEIRTAVWDTLLENHHVFNHKALIKDQIHICDAVIKKIKSK